MSFSWLLVFLAFFVLVVVFWLNGFCVLALSKACFIDILALVFGALASVIPCVDYWLIGLVF